MAAVVEAGRSHSVPAFSSEKNWRQFKGKHCLGRGSFGHIYAASNPETGSPWAVKLGGADVVREFEVLSGVLCEAPHTVRVKKLYSSAGKTMFAMERLSHLDLRRLSWSHAKKITFPTFCDIAKKFLEALLHYKKQRVLHGDIKPENCFFNLETKKLTIVDFGSVRFFGDESRNFPGTLEYFAPERAIELGEDLGPGVDMWALGATLFCAYTGKVLFVAPGGGNCKGVKDLIWSYKQQFTNGFFDYVGRSCLAQTKVPFNLDGLSAEEVSAKCVATGRDILGRLIGPVAPCAPPMPWKDRIRLAALQKERPEDVDRVAKWIINFLDLIFAPVKTRMTPEEGLLYFPSDEVLSEPSAQQAEGNSPHVHQSFHSPSLADEEASPLLSSEKKESFCDELPFALDQDDWNLDEQALESILTELGENALSSADLPNVADSPGPDSRSHSIYGLLQLLNSTDIETPS